MLSKDSSIVLFDMDGTLTKPREVISCEVLTALSDLSQISQIGIVTGSGLEYIKEQLGSFFDANGLSLDRVHFFPCNGTKYYRSTDTSAKLVCLHDSDMIAEIGRDTYRHILQTIFSFQLTVTLRYDIPYTGTFFQYRGSMLNWCPVGRSADAAARDEWIQFDREYEIRSHYIQELKDFIKKKNYKVDVALGGSTSFDIYPSGWDKTYVINHLGDFEKIMFVGDKCTPGGNDYHLYDLLSGMDEHQSYSVDSPTDTIGVIEKIKQELNGTAQ